MTMKKEKGGRNYDEKEGKEEEDGGKGEETEKQNKNLFVSGIHFFINRDITTLQFKTANSTADIMRP